LQQSQTNRGEYLNMPKRQVPPIEGERIVLRLLEKPDLPLTLLWRNQDKIRKWFVNSDVITEEQHYAWFERYHELDNDFIFLILIKELGNIPVGQISLYRVDWDFKSAEYGRLMIGNQAAINKGYAKQATRLLLEFGFGWMGLNVIHLEVKEDNAPAIAIYKAVGFTYQSPKNGLITMSIRKKI
jgi:RimJ/RimL family protein N-acetyltransferase